MTDISSAFAAFDDFNRQDPNIILINGEPFPSAFIYSLRLYEWILKLYPQAPAELLVAARCQHIGRWLTPRDSYPEGKTGYLNWRKDLSRFHAKTSGEILFEKGFDENFIVRVQQINLKENLKLDADVQAMENALCLVFLEFQLEEFMHLHDEDKLVTIIKKSWKKMDETGRKAATTLNFSERAAHIIQKATN